MAKLMTGLLMAGVLGGLGLGQPLAAPAGPTAARADSLGAADPALVTYAASFERWGNYYSVPVLELERVSACEDPSGDPEAVSSSGDFGLAQWHFSGPGLWFDLPDGQAGLMPWDVSVDEQVRMMALAFSLGDESSWSCAA